MSFILREASELCDSGKHFFGITPYFSEEEQRKQLFKPYFGPTNSIFDQTPVFVLFEDL